MAEPATRVALLARPGAACDNLQAALRLAGVDIVTVQDPGEGDPSALAAARPGAVLVALEPAVEDALERYDAVLSEPGRLVIYDEVAIAARREGWDAARWARHLAAKLGGHGDVLPPGAGNDDDIAAPAALAVPVASAEAALPRESGELSLDAIEFEPDAVQLAVRPARDGAPARAGGGIDFGAFTPEMMAAMTLESGPESIAAGAAAAPAAAPELADDVASPAPAQAAEAPAPVRFNLDEMALVDIEPTATPAAGPASFAHADAAEPAFAAAGSAAAGEGSEGGEGGVVVLAGIGGPDAVRQFLAALPAGFARPIIVRQRLDGGRHDRLVRQMQRATALPVEFAEAGRAVVAGHVYILPDGMTTTAGNGATAFLATDAPVPVLAGLPAAGSAVLVLSGSDPSAVPELMEAARAGALVAGQSPDDSFDGAAAAALVAAGGESHPAAELAQRLGKRWLSLEN